MSITRRIFLRNSALAVVGTAAVPSFLTRAAFGAVENRRPHQAPGRDFPARRCRWTEHRRPARRAAVLRDAAQHQHSAQVGASISTDSSGCILRSSAFQPLWQQGHLAIVHAAGSPDTTRSHFDAQDFMETGTPGVKITEDGWLNRSLHNLRDDGAELSLPRDCASGRRCRESSAAQSRPSP